VQPPGLPADDPAWAKDDALALLVALEGTIIAVVQVDAYVVPYGRQEVIHSGRRATYSHRLRERASDFAQRSRHSASEFISAGTSDELYVLFFSDQDDAEAAHGTAIVRAG